MLTAAPGCDGTRAVPAPRYQAAGATEPHRGGTYRVTINDDVRNLDPAIAYDEFSIIVEHLLYDTLLAYGPATDPAALELRPQLAETMEVSPDGLSYVLTLREGITFEDGTPITAADFKFALERVLDPATGSPGAQFYLGIAGAAERLRGARPDVPGIVADGRRLELRLVKADRSFPYVLAMKFSTPLARAWVERQGARLRDRPLASGPFRLVEWREGQRLTLARNDRYWDQPRPYLDGVVIDLMVSRDVAVLKFLKGEVDAVERLSSDQYVRFRASPAWQPYIHAVPAMNVFGELMNVERPPFDDVRVRRAMNYAVNKEDTIALYNGRAVVARAVLPPRMPGHDPTLEPYPHDPEKARQLLAEAGYPDGFDVEYVTLRDEISEKVAQSMQADLAKVGVRMRIKLMTFPAYLAAVGRRQLGFAYTAWFMDFPDPWNFLEVKFHSRMIADVGSNNETGYSNPEVDRLLDEARAEPDRAKRFALYNRAERIIRDDAPWIFHYHAMIVEVTQPYVKGYGIHPVWMRDLRDIWIDR